MQQLPCRWQIGCQSVGIQWILLTDWRMNEVFFTQTEWRQNEVFSTLIPSPLTTITLTQSPWVPPRWGSLWTWAEGVRFSILSICSKTTLGRPKIVFVTIKEEKCWRQPAENHLLTFKVAWPCLDITDTLLSASWGEFSVSSWKYFDYGESWSLLFCSNGLENKIMWKSEKKPKRTRALLLDCEFYWSKSLFINWKCKLLLISKSGFNTCVIFRSVPEHVQSALKSWF